MNFSQSGVSFAAARLLPPQPRRGLGECGVGFAVTTQLHPEGPFVKGIWPYL